MLFAGLVLGGCENMLEKKKLDVVCVISKTIN